MTVPRSVLAGIALLVLATACFATLDTTTKIVSAGVPVVMALWVRFTFQAVATALVLLPTRGWRGLRTAHPRFQCLRGLLLVLTSALAFFSLRFMPVAEFTAIVMIVPLAVTVLATTTLGETVSPLRWALVAGGFVGTLIIIRPGGEAFTWAALLPLGLVATNSAFQVLTSRLARTEDPLVMQFYGGWAGAAAVSLVLPLAWTLLPDWRLWAGLALIGLCGTVGHFLFIMALARAPASTLAPYQYAQIGFAMLAGWIVFRHVPDGWSLLGMALIAACGIVGAWLTVRESRRPVMPVEP